MNKAEVVFNKLANLFRRRNRIAMTLSKANVPVVVA